MKIHLYNIQKEKTNKEALLFWRKIFNPIYQTITTRRIIATMKNYTVSF